MNISDYLKNIDNHSQLTTVDNKTRELVKAHVIDCYHQFNSKINQLENVNETLRGGIKKRDYVFNELKKDPHISDFLKKNFGSQ